MRIKIFTTLLIAVVAVFSTQKSIAQQVEITLDPSALTPHDDGYYYSGVEVDEDGDGTMEFHNGCDDYYEDQDATDGYDPSINHKETGEQQDFSYFNCLIMPDCEAKGTPIDPAISTGYIQMHACLNSGTDSAVYSYIQTPAVSNLQSIYMETSSDVSINDKRQIPYNIEYSKDNGATWELTYYGDVVAEQGGYRVTYDGSVNLEIQEMIDASEVSPIVLRVITNDRGVPGAMQGQFVKLHKLTLTAEIADQPSAINRTASDNLVVYAKERMIFSENTEVEIFNLMGQRIGSGNIIPVPSSGIYFAKTQSGIIKKVLVK